MANKAESLNPDIPYLVSAEIAGTGLTVLDRIYAGQVDGPFEATGGSCGNVLISLAMLGHKVAPIVSLGDDEPGDSIVDELKRAGCVTEFVSRKPNCQSPVIAEILDAYSGKHRFSFTCPETSSRYPLYQPIDEDEVWSACEALEDISVFYADRLSPAILFAMERAVEGGAIVFFEPATRGDDELLRRALRFVSILKLSDDTSSTQFRQVELAPLAMILRTHGARGLTVSLRGVDRYYPSAPALRLIDSCGAGDMVTTGLLYYLLRSGALNMRWLEEYINEGIMAGQRLAALNCAFAGARGAFLSLGPSWIRPVLEGGDVRMIDALAVDPCAGYRNDLHKPILPRVRRV